jgi:hypothetical protein
MEELMMLAFIQVLHCCVHGEASRKYNGLRSPLLLPASGWNCMTHCQALPGFPDSSPVSEHKKQANVHHSEDTVFSSRSIFITSFKVRTLTSVLYGLFCTL